MLEMTKAVVGSPCGGGDGGQPDEGQNEQQQQQPVNRSSENAEIARCITPISHPGYTLQQNLVISQHRHSKNLQRAFCVMRQSENCMILSYVDISMPVTCCIVFFL